MGSSAIAAFLDQADLTNNWLDEEAIAKKVNRGKLNKIKLFIGLCSATLKNKAKPNQFLISLTFTVTNFAFTYQIS